MPEITTPPPRCTNPELMRQTLAHIEAYPDTWNQRTWATPPSGACGTAYCFAGWAVALTGARIDAEDETVEVESLPEDVRRRLREYHAVYRYEGDAYIPTVARVALGIAHADADVLFASYNGLSDLRRIVAELTEETR